jgi:hypothetical protein
MDNLTGELIITNMPIRASHEIISLTVNEFYNQALLNLNSLKLYEKIQNQDQVKEFTQRYKNYGITGHRSRSERIYTKIKEILSLRTSLLGTDAEVGKTQTGAQK